MVRLTRSATLCLSTFLVVIASGCSANRILEEPLPFHLAVIPPTVQVLGSAEEGAADQEELALRIRSGPLASSLQSALDGRCFARSTLLAFPDDVSLESFATWSGEERDAHWIREVQRVGADLVLDAQVTYSPYASSRANDRFWPNVMLFILGGPCCYFVDDRTYGVQARLQGSIYEVHAIQDRRASLQDARSRLTTLESRFESVTLDFLDRSGGNPLSILASIVVPAGFLAQGGDRVESQLETRAERGLCIGLEQEIRRSAREILEAERIAPFYVDSDLELGTESGSLVVRGDVVARQGSEQQPQEFVVQLGGDEDRGEFGIGVVDELLSTSRNRIVRYPFTARFGAGSNATEVRIQVLAGGRSLIRRSFTFSVDELPGSRAASRRAGHTAPSEPVAARASRASR